MERCTNCESTELREGTDEERLEVGGVAFVAQLPALVCLKCGHAFVLAADMERFDLEVACWLTSHGHRSAETLRFARKALGMRAAELAVLVGRSAETIADWESGRGDADVCVVALLGALLVDRLPARDSTLDRLRALQGPATVPAAAVRIGVNAGE